MKFSRAGSWCLGALLAVHLAAAQPPASKSASPAPKADAPKSAPATPSPKADPPKVASKVDEPKASPAPATTPAGGTAAKPAGETPKPVEPAAKPIEAPKPADPAKPKDRSEHVIYIPYGRLPDVFEKDGRTVLLPFAEYDRLLSLVRGFGRIGKPPVPAVLSSASYLATVSGDSAKVDATLAADVLTDDWVRIPLKFPGAAVVSATGGTLAASGTGEYTLLLQGRKRHELKIELRVPVTRSAEGRRLTLGGPAAGATSLDLTVPEAGVDLEVTPRPGSLDKPAAPNATRIKALLGATETVSVTWRAKMETAQARPLVTAGRRSQVTIADGVVQTRTRLDYQILRGELSELKLTLPAGERLLDLKAPGLRDWKLADGQGDRAVMIRFHAPVKSGVSVEVDSERPIPVGRFPVANVKAAEVERETGRIIVIPGEELTVSLAERVGVTRVAAGELGEEGARPNNLYFKFFQPDHRVSVETAPVAPRIAVESKHLLRLEEGRLRGESQLALDVQRAGIFSLRVRMPPGVDLDGVTGDNLERHESAADPAGAVVSVQFRGKLLGATKVTLNWSQARPDPAAPLAPAAPEPLDVSAERGALALLAHESFEVNLDPAKLKGFRAATPAELASLGFSIPAEPRMTLAATFRYLARPATLGFNVTRRRTRVVADLFHRVHVRENALVTSAIVAFDVQYAGTDTFELLVPQPVADRTEIVGAGIKEKKRGEPKDGMVPWTVQLHTRSLGRQVVTVRFEEPLNLKAGGAASAKIRLVRADKVERESGQVSVSKERTLALEDQPDPGAIDPIDPRQLEAPAEAAGLPGADQETQFAYRYARHPAGVTLAVTKNEIQRVVETVVLRSLVDSVVADEGPTRSRLMVWLKSSQRQRLTLRMPSAAKLLDVSVAGRSVLAEKDPTGEPEDYQINVSRTTPPDRPFAMVIVYETPGEGRRLDWGTFVPGGLPSLTLAAPTLLGDVAVQRTWWRVWLPRRYTAVGEPEGFRSDVDALDLVTRGPGFTGPESRELAGWMSEWAAAASTTVFEFPTVGSPHAFSSLTGRRLITIRYGWLPAMSVTASVLAVALLVILAVLPWERKVTVILTLALLTLAIGLLFPQATARWIGSSGWGLLVGGVMWGLIAAGQSMRWLTDILTARRAPPPALTAVGAGAESAAPPPKLSEMDVGDERPGG